MINVGKQQLKPPECLNRMEFFENCFVQLSNLKRASQNSKKDYKSDGKGFIHYSATGSKISDTIDNDTERDYFMDSNEALTYGIVDKILKKAS